MSAMLLSSEAVGGVAPTDGKIPGHWSPTDPKRPPIDGPKGQDLWRRADKVVLVDPHVPHFGWYRGATAVTPNAREAAQATGISFDDRGTASEGAFAVLREMELEALLVTRGEHGMSLYHGKRGEVHIPTVAKEVYDVAGAGDTVISVFSLALATGAGMVEGVVMANAAAGSVVREGGTSALHASDLITLFDT